jgi:uncharacterized protein
LPVLAGLQGPLRHWRRPSLGGRGPLPRNRRLTDCRECHCESHLFGLSLHIADDPETELLNSVLMKGTIVLTMRTANERLSTTLFGKARRAVLSVLFGNADRAFYTRELARSTGLGMGALQRELVALSEAGIIERTKQGNHIFFRANTACPIFQELKGIVAKTVGFGDTLQRALAPLAERIRWAFIHGSTAKGTETASSDVDVLVVGDAAFEEVVSALYETQEKTGREINPTVYGVDEFLQKVKQGHHFLTTVMGEPKIFLIGEEDELQRLAQ